MKATPSQKADTHDETFPDQREGRNDSVAAIVSVLPARAHDLARMRLLADKRRPPVVTVIGKYNHGKSRLLNELIGQAAFSVADKRETVALSAHVQGGVRWLDAPGLDADVGTADDRHALRATWLESDIRLFVHALKEGELDASERALLHSLHSDELRSRRQTLLVLSQLDQLADEPQYLQVMQAIVLQAPALEMYPVSATRHRQGVDGDKALMLVRSGIPALQAALQQAVARVPQARAHEAGLLVHEIHTELQQLLAVRVDLARKLHLRQAQQREHFDADLVAVLIRVGADIEKMLDVPGPDHSLTPDSFANQFEVTPGKLERNRLQVGYSKACIAINAILIRHGVSELPLAQQTAVRSLDHIMVAVMGVYVKYRKDLKQIFCESAGRERLQREFARYFELSSDRVALALATKEADDGVVEAQCALGAFDGLFALQASP